MKLSRLTLRPGSGALWRLPTDTYGFHQLVWRLFDDRPDRRRDFLYRLDLDPPQPGHRGPVLYVLSEREPRDRDHLWHIETKPFAPVLAPGDRLAFDLRANPVVTREGKRHDLVMDAKKQAGDARKTGERTQAEWVQHAAPPWLLRRAEALGVSFAEETLRAEGYQSRRFAKGTGGKEISISTCDFQGLLEVRDPDRFVAAVEAGIGPAKGFGCGLMLLRRAR